MPTLITELHSPVLLLVLNRPERANSLDVATAQNLGDALRHADEDPNVRAVVLTASGDRHFCAGMDLREFSDGGTASLPGILDLLEGKVETPVIAAVNGSAVAGGFELTAACDLVVAAEHATFGIPEAKRGLVAAGGGTDLPRRVPLAVALEMGLTGELIDATRAHGLGLVNAVVPGQSLLRTALTFAEAISANGPLAVAGARSLMWQAAGRTELAPTIASIRHVLDSADAREGAVAFVERRPPRWRGV